MLKPQCSLRSALLTVTITAIACGVIVHVWPRVPQSDLQDGVWLVVGEGAFVARMWGETEGGDPWLEYTYGLPCHSNSGDAKLLWSHNPRNLAGLKLGDRFRLKPSAKPFYNEAFGGFYAREADIEVIERD